MSLNAIRVRWLRAPLVERLIWSMVAVGAGLRTIQFLARPSLYIAEIAVVRNLTERGMGRLLTARIAGGLDSSVGYLAAQKLAVTVAGPTEWGVRLVPFLASLISLWLFVRLTAALLEDWGRLIAITAFATALPFLLIVAAIKPHATVDTAVCLALLLMGATLLNRPPDRQAAVGAAVAGFLSVWFAEAAVFMLAAVAAAIGVDAIRRRDGNVIRRLAPAFLSWGVGWALTFRVGRSQADPGLHEKLRAFYGATPPAFPRLIGWLYRGFAEVVGRGVLHYRAPSAFFVGLAIGVLMMGRRSPARLALVSVPVIAAAVAAVAGLYIFRGLYLVVFLPPLFVLVAEGVDGVRRALAPRSTVGAFATAAMAVALPVGAIAAEPPVYRIAETRPVLAYVAAHRRPTDAIYGFFATRPALQYYGPLVGIKPNEYTAGDCHHGDPRGYFMEIDQFRGQPRLWVIFSHDPRRYSAKAEILHYLDRIGQARDSIVIAGRDLHPYIIGASAYLYDLSEPERLAAATAQSMPLLRQIMPGPGVACGWGPLAGENP